MSARVFIVGNSGAARECYWLFQEICESSSAFALNHEFGGFFDWKGYAGNLKELQSLYRGNVEAYPVAAKDLFIIGVGDPALRGDIFKTMRERGAKFMNLAHPWTSINQTAVIGEGNIFHRGSSVYCNAAIGDGNYLNGFVNISHDAVIGNFNFLAPYAIVLGLAVMGDYNYIGPHAMLLAHAKMGSFNNLAPASALYKGCRDHCRLTGAPALKIGEI